MQDTQTFQTPRAEESFSFADFLAFKSMIALKIMQAVYLLVAVLITLGGIMLMLKGNDRYDDGLIPGGFLSGVLVILIGNVIWRIWCELLIVFFTINRSLHQIEKNTKKN